MTKKKKNDVESNQNTSSFLGNDISQFDQSLKSIGGNKISLIPKNESAFDSSIQLGSLATVKSQVTAPMADLGLNDGFIKAPYSEQAVGVYNPTIADFYSKAEKKLSEEEIEDIKNLLEEKKSSKDDKNPTTVEEVAEEVMRKLKAQEVDEKTKREKDIMSGLEKISEKIKNGGYNNWTCPKCGHTIEKLNDIKKIKKYLKEFKNGKLKPCLEFGKNHLNWFEIGEDGMVWGVKTIYESEFRKQKKRD